MGAERPGNDRGVIPDDSSPRCGVPNGTWTFVEAGNQGKSAGCGLSIQSILGWRTGWQIRHELSPCTSRRSDCAPSEKGVESLCSHDPSTL